MEKKFPLKTLIFVLILLKIFVIFWILNNLVLFRESLAYLAHKPVKAKFAKEEVVKNYSLTKNVSLDIYGIHLGQKRPIILFFINHFWKGAQISHYAHVAKFFHTNFSKKFLQIFVSLPKESLLWPSSQSYYQKEIETFVKLQEFLKYQAQNFGGDVGNIMIFSYESGATFALNFLAFSNLKVNSVFLWSPIFPKYGGGLLEKSYFNSQDEEQKAYASWEKAPKKVSRMVLFALQKEIPDFLKSNPTIPFSQNPMVALFRIGRGEEVDEKMQKIWQDILD